MSSSRISVLGPVALTVGDRVVPLESPTQRRLLLRLAVDAPQAVSVDALAESIWGADLPRNPTNALRYHIWKLREAIGNDHSEIISTTHGGYQLMLDRDDVDADLFESLTSQAAGLLTTDPERSASLAEQALLLFSGPPYADADDAEFAQPEIRRLTEARRSAEETRAGALVESGRTAEAIPLLQGLLEQFPLSEGLWSALMIALYREDRHGEALRTYQRAREQLGDELGIEPSQELQELEEQMLLHDPSLARDTSTLFNVPSSIADLIGREGELEDLHQILGASRLVSIVGVGGAGKTRLAIEIGHRIQPRFRDGAWFIDLTALRSGDDLFGAILEAAQLSVVDDALETSERVVLAYLSTRTSLLIVDNCEHLVDEVAGMITTILARCGHVRILTTGRMALDVPGEYVYAIPTLELPQTDTPTWDDLLSVSACAMFIDRVQRGGAQIRPTNESATIVAEVCRQLEGLPLALELAAPRVRTMGLAQLASDIGELSNTLGSQRVPDERHQTIGAMIEWSHDLLTVPEQLLFDRLAVFIGGFDVEAAERVCGDDLLDANDIAGVLISLVEQSMIERMPDDMIRFRILEPFRLFAVEHLEERGELAETMNRHASYMLDLTREAELRRRSREEPECRRQLAAESANVRAALTRLADQHQWSQLATVVASVTWFWIGEWRLDEAERWIDILGPHWGDISNGDRARLHLLGAFLATNGRHSNDGQHEIVQAISCAREAGDHLMEADAILYKYSVGDPLVETPKNRRNEIAQLHHVSEMYEDAGDAWGIVNSLTALSRAFLWNGEDDRAIDPVVRAIAIATRTGNDAGLARAQVMKGSLEIHRSRHGDTDHADVPAIYDQAIEISKRTNDHEAHASALLDLGVWYGLRGNLAESARWLTECTMQADGRGDLFSSTVGYCLLSDTERRRRRTPSSIRAAISALDRSLIRSVDSQVAWVIEMTARLLADLDNADLGAKLIGAAETIRVRQNSPMQSWDVDGYDETLAVIKAATGDTYVSYHAEGANWSITHAGRTARDALVTSGEHLAAPESA